MGQQRRCSCSKIPQHCRAPAVPTPTRGCLLTGPQLCSSLVATQRGLLVPAWSTQLAILPPASTSLTQHHLQHYHVPLKWTPWLSHSWKNQSQTIPTHPCPSMAHQLLPFGYLAPKGKKKKKIRKLRHLKFAMGFKTLTTMTVTSDKHFQTEIGLGARKNVCVLPWTYQS